MILGSYLFDNSEGHNIFEKIFFILFLLFFGGILVVGELTVAEKIANWWNSSELNFLWKVYIIKKYDNLKPKQVDYIKKQFSEEGDKNSDLYKHLKLILKRNGSKEI